MYLPPAAAQKNRAPAVFGYRSLSRRPDIQCVAIRRPTSPTLPVLRLRWHQELPQSWPAA